MTVTNHDHPGGATSGCYTPRRVAGVGPNQTVTPGPNQARTATRTLWNDLGQPDDITTVEEDSLLRAFASWWYTNVHRVSDYGPRHDPISRSTSVIANVIDDCDDWAIAEIRSRVAWAGARDELERRVTQALTD